MGHKTNGDGFSGDPLPPKHHPDRNDDLPTTPDGIKKEKRRILKNVFLISFCFLLTFNAFQGLSRLQSSLHRTEGMGVINSSVLYGALVLSCLFLPKLLISQVGHKWTIPICFIGYILWMAANGYAVWGTMVTASIIVGLCAAPLWTAQCAYFTKMATRWSLITGDEEAGVVSRFFGYFFMFFQISSITGSVISSTVLRPMVVNGSESDTLSVWEAREYCGLNDCPGNNISNPNTRKPDEATVWTMLGIYIGIACLSVIIVSIFVDRLPKSLRDKKDISRKEVGQLALKTLKHLRHPAQIILIPLTMYSGFEQAFYGAEWTNSFITCSLGIWKVGLVTLPFGVVNAIVSLTTGQLVKHIGRIPIFTAGMVVDLAIQITLYTWPLDKSKEYALYILSGLWGLTDGIWQTQLNALYGAIFIKEPEAAFSNYRMWESFGFIIVFGYSNFICTEVKLAVVTSFLVLGMLGYYIVEAMHRTKHGSREQSKGKLAHTHDGKTNNGFPENTQGFNNLGFQNDIDITRL